MEPDKKEEGAADLAPAETTTPETLTPGMADPIMSTGYQDAPVEEKEQSDEEVKEARGATDTDEPEKEDEDPQEGLDPEEGEDEDEPMSEETVHEADLNAFTEAFGNKTPFKVLVDLHNRISEIEKKIF